MTQRDKGLLNAAGVKSKLVLTTLTVSTTVLLTAVTLLFVVDAIGYYRHAIRGLETVARIIGVNGAAAVTFGDARVAQMHLAGLAEEPGIATAAILDANGRVLASFEQPACHDLAGTLPFQLDGTLRRGSHVCLFRSISLEGEKIGTVLVCGDLRPLYLRIARFGATVAIILLTSIGAAWLLSRRLHASVVQPLLALTRTASQVSAERNYGLRAIKISDDEIGKLVDVFNDMLSQIENQEKELLANYEALLDYQQRLHSLTAQLHTAEENERRRLGRDLHDSVCQLIWGARAQLSAIQRDCGECGKQAVAEAAGLLTQALTQARTLSFQLSPPHLYDFGLASALEDLAKNTEAGCGIRTRVDDQGVPERLPDALSILVFRSVQELIQNVIKHAEAHSIMIRLAAENGRILVAVEDDGKGFAAPKPGETAEGFGLISIRERVTGFGGTLRIQTDRRGTAVAIELPLTYPTQQTQSRETG